MLIIGWPRHWSVIIATRQTQRILLTVTPSMTGTMREGGLIMLLLTVMVVLVLMTVMVVVVLMVGL